MTLQVLSRLSRIEDDRRIEIREEDDENRGKDPVNPASRDRVGHHREPIHIEQRCKLSREIDQTAREDDRNNTRRIDLDRQVGVLATHHATTLDALRVADGNTTLSAFDVDDRRDAEQNDDQDQKRNGDTHSKISLKVDRGEDSRRNGSDDGNEDDEGHAVTNAMLGDELTHPHDESSTNDQREDDEDIGDDLGDRSAEDNAIGLGLEKEEVADGVDQTEAKRKVTRNLGDATTARLPSLAQRPTAGMTPCINCMMIDAVM